MRRLLFILFAIIPAAAFGMEKAYIPEVFTEDRYQHIWARKPFSPPTAPAPMLQAEGIDQQYALSGLLKIGGEWTAFVQDRKTLKRHRISKTVNEIGLQLVSVRESTPSEPPTVTLRAGQQTGVIHFDPAVMKRANDSVQAVVQGESSKPPTHQPSGATPASLPSGGSHSSSPIQTLHPNLLDLSK